MNKKINESFNFLLSEYKRLKLKDKKEIITKHEQETLMHLEIFLGKK